MSRGFIKEEEPLKILTQEEINKILEDLGPLIADGDENTFSERD